MSLFEDVFGGKPGEDTIRKSAQSASMSARGVVERKYEAGDIMASEVQPLLKMADAHGPDAALQALAEKEAQSQNISVAKGYQRVMKTARGRQLYADLKRAQGS